MATVVKGKLSDLKGHIQTTQSLMTITNEKLKSQKEIQKQVKQNYDDLIDRNNNKIAELLAKDTVLVTAYNTATSTLTELKTKSAELDKKIFKFKNFVSVESKLSVQYDTLCAEILTTESQQSCSCCGQELTETVKCEILSSKYSRRDEYKTALEEVSVKLKELTELEETKEELQTVLKKAVLDQTMATREKQILQNRIEELTEENADLETKHLDNNEIYDTIKTTEQEIKSQTKIYQTAIKEQIHYDVVYDLLRDGGLKSKIIRHYVPVINNFVNKYLEKLNLYVDFNLNQEFKETIKSRYRDEFSYLSFSEGEKQRIDLAILMTWREIAKMKNSLNCNLLIFDEILDSSLDATGTENFLKILTKMKNKCSVFIISHKSDQLIDKFDQGIQIEKKNNFSRIKTT
jgi:DNA repair exonuclease SbcCD ATPase subunit